jgi:alkylation response protein AidB-like acyl-CoA dehydrogenase
MAAAVDVTSAEWLERARALEPVIETWRDEGERERRLPASVFEAMREAGFFRMWTPRRHGGYEVDNETRVRVVEEISRQDGAAGWNLFIGGTWNLVASCLPLSASDEIFGGTESSLAGSLAPSGQATPVPGGHRLNGRWSFASGCQQANWMAAAALIVEDGKPRMLAEGRPEMKLFLLPAADCQILDTWFTAGLRGTGSHDFEVNDVFIPGGREFSLDLLLTSPAEPPIRSSFFQIAIPSLAAVGLGIARDAIDSFKALTARKTPRGGTSSLLNYQTVHEKVGRAEAILGAARAYLLEVVRSVALQTGNGDKPNEELTAPVRLAATYAAERAAEASSLMFSAGGGSSVYATSRLERCFRDANMVTHHHLVQPLNFEMVGQYFLGLGLQMRR